MGKSVKYWYKKSLKETKLVEPKPYKFYAENTICSMENWKLRCFLENKRSTKLHRCTSGWKFDVLPYCESTIISVSQLL